MDGKDDDDMDAVLNKNDADPGKRKSKSGTHKSLITRNLRLAYGEVAGEPVPQRFLDLLDRIEDPQDDES
ncbi:MAG: NepR family anti-sigma factor [Hyphomonadaceae bacterium]